MLRFVINDEKYKAYEDEDIRVGNERGLIYSHSREGMSEFEYQDASIKLALEKKLSKVAINAMFKARELILEAKNNKSFKLAIIGNNSLSKSFAKELNLPVSMYSLRDVKELFSENDELGIKDGEKTQYFDMACSFVGQKLASTPRVIKAQNYETSELIARINIIKEQNYRPYFEPSHCDGCLKCVRICEEEAINLQKSQIKIDPALCVKCSACISICPQGSIKRGQLSKKLLRSICELFKGQKLMLLDDMDELLKTRILGDFDIKDYAFLVLPSLDFSLDEYLLLIQELGSKVLILSSRLNDISKTNIAFVNELCKRAFDEEGIIYAKSLNEELLARLSLQPRFSFSFIDDENFLRANLAARLSAFIKSDLGDTKLLKDSFARLDVDENCTLCMACESSCKSGAFFGSEADLALKFIAINCSNCSKCMIACPENSIKIAKEGIELSPSFLAPKIVARDEKYACIMCHEEFATKKSIEKVAKLMGPVFSKDEKKLKSLYCCPTCKVKVMFSSS